jgi:hypothetical protein
MSASTGGEVSCYLSEKSQRQLRRDRWVFWTIVSSALLVPVAIFIVATVSDAYDETHRVSIECTVMGAEGGLGSGGGTWSRVQISTSDCGTLTLTWGITESNRDAVASELAGGGRFAFQIGATTQSTWKLHEMLRITPMVSSFQQID